MKWKIQRDTAKRGYSVEQVLQSLEKRKNDSANFIRPQRTFADIVVQFYPPEGHSEETGPNLNVRHTLRPTQDGERQVLTTYCQLSAAA